MVKLTLLIDDRERKVIPYLENDGNANHPNVILSIKRMEIGDYAIMRMVKNDKGKMIESLVAIIERKSLKDMAQSICDGRSANLSKLKRARDETGCRIIYLIEGKVNPNPKKKFNRIPYKTLQARIDHLGMRDGVYVIYAANPKASASRLLSFVQNVSTINRGLEQIPKNTIIKPENDKEEIVDEEKKVEGGGDEQVQSLMTLLTTRIEKPNELKEDIVWASLPGVGMATARALNKLSGITIADFLLGKITTEKIMEGKYDSGRNIGTKIAKKIHKLNCKGTDSQIEKRFSAVLRAIPRIGIETAKKVMCATSFRELLEDPVIRGDGDENIKERSEHLHTHLDKTIGKATCKNIIKFIF